MKSLVNIKAASLFAALVVGAVGSSVTEAQSRFFGYYANNGYIGENHDHTTVTQIWAGYADRNTATSVIMQELAQAKAKGIKAIVGVEAFVFDVGTSGNARCPFRQQNSASTHWNTFVNALVSNGYLVPNNPGASTIAAFYPVDEPELCGLTDSSGQAHAALRHAVNTIRNHPYTNNFPLAVLASKKYGNAQKGIQLFDWAGLDNYSVSTSEYLSQFATFESRLLSHQRSILVPQASQGGFMSSYGSWHQPQPIIDHFLSNPRAIGLMPFLWGHHDTTGVRGIAELREAYTGIGKHIKLGAPLPLRASLGCWGSGGLFECQASAQYGVPPYTYTWNTSQGFGDFAVYHTTCGYPFLATLTVRDSVGNQVTRNTTLNCPIGSQPR